MRGTFVTDQEREKMAVLRERGHTYKQIAEMMDRPWQTVARCFNKTYYSVTAPKHTRPIPAWKAPKTGSSSGFIRPIDYSRLVAGR